jgi:hypothetical protein
MSLSVTILSFPTTSSSSACNFFAQWGLRKSSAIAHSTVFADVSVPARSISYNQNNTTNKILHLSLTDSKFINKENERT